MVYNYISGRKVVAILYNDYGIKSTGWEGNAPRWILNAITEIGALKTLESAEWIGHVGDVSIEHPTLNALYHCKLPLDVRKIDMITYNNQPVTIVNVNGKLTNRNVRSTRSTFDSIAFTWFQDPDTSIIYNTGITSAVSQQVIDPESTTDHVCKIEAGVMEFDFPSGDIVVEYKKIPVILDDETNEYYPLIPDHPIVLQYISIYLLHNILMMGYKHPIFSFESRDPNTNIVVVKKQYMKDAKSKINKMTSQERNEIAKIMGSMFADYNDDVNKNYNYSSNNILL